MSAEKCVVTGGAGFIGSHLVDLLVEEGCEVQVVDNLSSGRRENLNAAAHFHSVDVRDPEALSPCFDGCRWVFHAAALPRIQPSFDDPIGHERVNVEGTINCLVAARDAGVARFLYFGSSAVYGTPDELPTDENAAIRCYNPYALQKYAAEQYALMLGERWGLPVVSLRLFNVYGPRSYVPGNPNSAYSPVIGVFHHLRSQGRALTITGSGEQSRDFIHARDVARAFLDAARSDCSGEVFNVGAGQTYTINHLASMMSDNREYLPERPNEAAITQADISSMCSKTNWTPSIPLEQGLTMLDD